MLTLTKEQQQRIEENKRNALELKAKKLAEKQRNNSVGTGPVNNPFSKQYGTPVKLEKETLSFPLKRNNSPDVSLQETYKKLATGNEITPGKTILNFYSKETSMKEHKKPNSAFSNSTSCSVQESSNSFKSQTATPHYSNYGSKSSNTQAPFSVTTGYCKLISKDKFVVDVGYHKRMIDIFKTIKSGTYGKLCFMLLSLKHEPHMVASLFINFSRKETRSLQIKLHSPVCFRYRVFKLL